MQLAGNFCPIYDGQTLNAHFLASFNGLFSRDICTHFPLHLAAHTPCTSAVLEAPGFGQGVGLAECTMKLKHIKLSLWSAKRQAGIAQRQIELNVEVLKALPNLAGFNPDIW